jgi:glycosyltransferase involved in cell wall biosynthesis
MRRWSLLGGHRRRRSAVRVLVIIENVPYARDHRARKQVGSLLRMGYRVGVISRRDPENLRYRRPGLRIYQYPSPPERPGLVFFAIEYSYSLVAATLLMLRARVDGRFHIVQTGHPPDIYFLLAFPARVLGARFVVDQRDLSPEVYADRFGKTSGIVPGLLRAMERASHRVADGIVCVNHSLAHTVVTRSKVDAGKVTVVGNGPIMASTKGRRPVPELRAGYEHLVCWLGVMGPQDHADIAISAAAHYISELKRQDTLFVFIGAGEALDISRKLAVDLGVSDVVRFSGWLEEARCFDYLATAELALDSNLQPEVTPVKGLEYMAHGLPFVAFDLRETRAMAGRAARYVAPGDAVAMAREIARLLDDPRERRAMGQVGRDLIRRRLAWDTQEPGYLALIDRLTAQPGRPTLDPLIGAEQ